MSCSPLVFSKFLGLVFLALAVARTCSGQPDRPTIFPMPSTNEVVQAMPSWLWLCQLLGVNPGAATNISDVDWNKSLVYNNPHAGSYGTLLIVFKSGARLTSLKGVALGYTARDSRDKPGGQFGEPKTDLPGKIKYRWQDLAKGLEKILVDKFGVSKDYLAPYLPQTTSPSASAALGSQVPDRRVIVLWLNKTVQYEDQALGAEFDLETGQLTCVGLNGPTIAKAVAQAQGKRF